MARDGRLESLGLQPLRQKASWTFAGDSFPSEAFYLRGEEAHRVFHWSDRLMKKWNDGLCDVDEFLRSENAFNMTTTFGSDRPEFVEELADCKTISFELPQDDVFFEKYPGVDVQSVACIAASGAWVTAPHIEWGGGESVAKLLSGSKLWVIATRPKAAEALQKIATYSGICDLLREDKKRSKGRKGSSLQEQLYYHIGQAGDVIVQPGFATHLVITEPSFSRGRRKWACVGGFEGLDNRVSDRGRRLFNHFITGVNRAVFQNELRVHGFGYLLRLLKIEDCRRSYAEYVPNENHTLAESRNEKDITTHCRVLYQNGYDLLESLRNESDASHAPSSSKRQKLTSTSDDFRSRYSDITKEELRNWPEQWIRDIDHSAAQRT